MDWFTGKVGDIVVKRSGKPFKSGAKTAIVSRFGKKMFPPAANCVNHELIEKEVLYFSTEEENYFVVANQCEKAEQHNVIDFLKSI